MEVIPNSTMIHYEQWQFSQKCLRKTNFQKNIMLFYEDNSTQEKIYTKNYIYQK